MWFGRQLFYSFNRTSTVVRNLTALSSTTDKINRISNQFWERRRHEYCSKFTWDTTNIKILYKLFKINVNDIALIYDEKVPRHFWRIAIVTGVLPSRDSEIRRAIVRIGKTNAILDDSQINSSYISYTYHDTSIHIMTLTKQIRQGSKSESEKQLHWWT